MNKQQLEKEEVDKMTLQEAFDYAVQKIVEQGGRCIDNHMCVYGNTRGMHCAVGWLLDENERSLILQVAA